MNQQFQREPHPLHESAASHSDTLSDTSASGGDSLHTAFMPARSDSPTPLAKISPVSREILATQLFAIPALDISREDIAILRQAAKKLILSPDGFLWGVISNLGAKNGVAMPTAMPVFTFVGHTGSALMFQDEAARVIGAHIESRMDLLDCLLPLNEQCQVGKVELRIYAQSINAHTPHDHAEEAWWIRDVLTIHLPHSPRFDGVTNGPGTLIAESQSHDSKTGQSVPNFASTPPDHSLLLKPDAMHCYPGEARIVLITDFYRVSCQAGELPAT